VVGGVRVPEDRDVTALLRVTSPSFVAGAEFAIDGRLVRCAPILRRRASTLGALVTYARLVGWGLEWVL
jgi:hypothetical protein